MTLSLMFSIENKFRQKVFNIVHPCNNLPHYSITDCRDISWEDRGGYVVIYPNGLLFQEYEKYLCKEKPVQGQYGDMEFVLVVDKQAEDSARMLIFKR